VSTADELEVARYLTGQLTLAIVTGDVPDELRTIDAGQAERICRVLAPHVLALTEQLLPAATRQRLEAVLTVMVQQGLGDLLDEGLAGDEQK
jgi:hypothetical protein